MYPSLVEPNIKNVIISELKEIKRNKFYIHSNYLNIVGFLFISLLIVFILWLKYTGKKDIKTQLENEKKKKEYILSKLSYFQRMKQREYTNMPI
jgi:Na+/H+ antiporter NhaD/arsenite permease-like protein